MKHSFHFRSSLSVLSLLIGTLTLVGCGGALNIPDSVASSNAAGPPVAGSVYGGHAPITGAHVYLLQPSTTAYGGPATSILGNNGATSAGGYTLTPDVNDPNVPVGSKYETTDSSGGFNFTGAYTCTVGQPVYIYAYGGNIGPIAASTVTATLTITATSETNTGGRAPVYTYTFTAANTGANPLVAGDTVTLALVNKPNNPNKGTGWNGLTTGTVVTANTTGFTFSGTTAVAGTSTGTATYTYTTPATPATNNNSIVELATLGNCPSSGNFSTAGNGALSFIYMNEVSTVATAYTFQPFTLSTNTDAWHIGTSGTTQALLGIANAADTAAQLYNIQGGTLISGTQDGEGHLANVQTISSSGNSNQGNGLVPQATIDSLADILANCIDSVPTTVGTPTTQCTSLFNIATDDGTTTGTKPVDTATAAINIARFPAGNNSSNNVDTTYAADIFALQGTGTFPYVPNLSAAPNDWTIAINFPYTAVTAYPLVSNNTLGKAESIEVDALGQIWITAQTADDIVRWSPLGIANAANPLGYIPGYVSIDGSNNAWTGNAVGDTGIFEAGYNGVFTTTFGSGYNKAYVNIADKAGDDYFFANTAAVGGVGGTGGNYEMFEYPAGSTPSTTPTQYSISPSIITAGDNIAHGAIDASGDFWLTTETSNQISRVTATGTRVFAFATPNSGGGTGNQNQPEFPAIDHNGNAWIPIQSTAGQVYKVTPTGGTTILTSNGAGGTTATGAELSSTFGSAVDGNGNVWITNRSGNYGTVSGVAGTNTILILNGSGAITGGTTSQAGAGTIGTVNTAISPPTNYVPAAQYSGSAVTKLLNDSLNVAIDPSGNVWITNYLGSAVVELVGAAAPVVTPLSVAAGNNTLGQKP